MNWADWLNDTCILRMMDICWNYKSLLFCTGIVWYRLSANVVVRCFKLRKLKNYKLGIKFIFCFHWSYKKYNTILGYAVKYSWPISLQEFFTFDFFDLLILIPGVQWYIVVVFFHTSVTWRCWKPIFSRYLIRCNKNNEFFNFVNCICVVKTFWLKVLE